MKFYNIKDEYINYLKKYDAKVVDNKKGKRPYVGVVLEIDGIKYYTPFTSPKEKHRKMKARFLLRLWHLFRFLQRVFRCFS